MVLCNDPLPPSLACAAPVSAASHPLESWIFHTGGPSMWQWMIAYAIHMGHNSLERIGAGELLARIDGYVEEGTNFSMPLRKEWFEHLPIEDWIGMLGPTGPYMEAHIRHADDEAYWARASVPRNAPAIDVPVFHVSSWYDIFAEGAPACYRAIVERGGPRGRRTQRLLMGPWAHLFPYDLPTSQGTGDIDHGHEARIDLRATLLRWFDHWLKDRDTGIMDEPPVSVFTMGDNRWKRLDSWPPPNAQPVRWYLDSAGRANSSAGDGVLSTRPPGGAPSDRFTYDPGDPVPTRGGQNLSIPLGVMDQAEVEEREDVLVFTSDVLDRDLEVTGPVTVTVWASSSAVDTDFTAKLVDVWPSGYCQNLLDGVIRARYRESRFDPRPIEPGRAYRYEIDLWATSNVFKVGHRIRLEVSSSNFPRFDRNLNTGEPFGKGSTWVVAEQTVFHEPGRESYVTLPVVPR